MKLVLTVIYLISSIFLCHARQSNDRFVGGNSGLFPYIAILGQPYQMCDGSILTKTWILTAAHCVKDPTNLTVTVGRTGSSNGFMYNIAQIVSHNGFTISTMKHDIALIKIVGELEFGDVIKPVTISAVEDGDGCLVAGWGTTTDSDYPNNVQFLEVNAMSLEDCQKHFLLGQEKLYLGEESVCAFADRGRGPCYGDSGGPLVCNGGVAGIVSYAIKACGQGYPDVYTRVEAYLDWIEEVIDMY